MLARFAEELSDVAVVERPPTLDGRMMTMTLAPKRDRPQVGPSPKNSTPGCSSA